MTLVSRVFISFEGLHTNLGKSETLLVGEMQNVEDLESNLMCFVSFSKVLELSLTLSKHISLWDPIMEYKQKRLSCLEENVLIKRGMLKLIRSMVSSISIYLFFFFSLFPLLVDVVNWMEKKFKGIFFGLAWARNLKVSFS